MLIAVDSCATNHQRTWAESASLSTLRWTQFYVAMIRKLQYLNNLYHGDKDNHKRNAVMIQSVKCVRFQVAQTAQRVGAAVCYVIQCIQFFNFLFTQYWYTESVTTTKTL